MTTISLDQITLDRGSHRNFEEGACLLEVASCLAGEPFSDHPPCVSPVITSYGIGLNDRLGDEDRQKLKPFLFGMLNTAGDGLDDVREFMLADWAIRVALPRWLYAAGLTAEATRLHEMAPVTDAATLEQARDAARAVRTQTYKLRQARRADLRDKILAEMKKNPKAYLTTAAAADAAADAVVAAASDAVADSDSDADAASVAAAVAAADGDAAAAAAAVAAAVAVAVAAAAADGVAVARRWSARWTEVYTAVRANLLPIYRAGFKGSKYAEVRDLNLAEGIELLGKIIKPALPTI